MIYPGANERRARANGIGNAEGVLGEGVQGTTGVIEEFEGLVTGVDDGRGDPQVLQSVHIGVGGRGPDGQAGGSRDGDRRGDEGDEGRAKGRGEHCEGVRGGDRDETAEPVNEPDLNSLPATGVTGEQQPPDRRHWSAGVHECMQEIVRGMKGQLEVFALSVNGRLEVTSPTIMSSGMSLAGMLRCLHGGRTGQGEAIAKGRAKIHKHQAAAVVSCRVSGPSPLLYV